MECFVAFTHHIPSLLYFFFFFVFASLFPLFTQQYYDLSVLTLKLPLCVSIVNISCSVSFFVTSFDWDSYRGKKIQKCSWIMFTAIMLVYNLQLKKSQRLKYNLPHTKGKINSVIDYVSARVTFVIFFLFFYSIFVMCAHSRYSIQIWC